jgi:hypothetical protein
MRKSNIKQLLKQSIVNTGKALVNTETYDPLFQKYEKTNIHKSHKVPKINIRQPKYR